jgi:hypothetical protein
MRLSLIAPALGIALCLTAGMVRVHGSNRTLASDLSQDDKWTVIEYPEGQEVAVALMPDASMPDASGRARVTRKGNETDISLDLSGLKGDKAIYQVYVVDSLGNATLLDTLIITDGAGSLNAKTPLSKFMIVVSPEANITTIASETSVTLRSSVPNGFTVVSREETSGDVESAEGESAEASASNSTMKPALMDPPGYYAPLLGVGSLRRGANSTMRAILSSGFEGARANIVVKPLKNGHTQIKVRFTNLKAAPVGTQYLLWQAGPDNSYTRVGPLIQMGKRRESVIDAETALSDFGLFITLDDAEASTPAGGVVATIIK